MSIHSHHREGPLPGQQPAGAGQTELPGSGGGRRGIIKGYPEICSLKSSVGNNVRVDLTHKFTFPLHKYQSSVVLVIFIEVYDLFMI